jgi:hypothetical protein
MTRSKPEYVRLSDEQVDMCDRLAEDIVDRYISDAEQQVSEGDPLHAMPWTRELMSEQELRRWLASRKEATRAIDVETCEVGGWYADELDPYGILGTLEKMRGEFSEDTVVSINRCGFVRSHTSNGWIQKGDLPTEKYKALEDRLDRECRRRRR